MITKKKKKIAERNRNVLCVHGTLEFIILNGNPPFFITDFIDNLLEIRILNFMTPHSIFPPLLKLAD